MKLLTTLKPRRDGTVVLRSADMKTAFVFSPDENGDLVADVTDEALVATCLASGNFQPADEEDFAAAEAMLKKIEEEQAPKDGDDDGDDDEADPNALPVEANTPPVAHATSGKKKRAPSA
jgi:phosphosulfolactate phosphohydrolase-like enzyme